MKKLVMLLAALSMLLLLAGCGGDSKKTEKPAAPNAEKKISIAYQYGLAYAPAVIAKEQGLIEKYYKEAAGEAIKVEWVQMASGANINTGITSGNIDVGFMGIAPAVTGISKGLNYKIFTNLSGQEHGMMSNDPAIKSVKDLIGTKKQIALVNIGSIQHIILAKALADNGMDAHALDSNLVAMKHPDGMAALESGSLPCHLTSSPYIFMEHKNSKLHEIPEVKKAWTVKDSFIVGVASKRLHDDAKLYGAVCKAIAEGVNFVNNKSQKCAELMAKYDKNPVDVELQYIKNGNYSVKTSNLLVMAKFMAANKFIKDAPKDFRTLTYDNVEGD
jgi:NitT/TauT family transport system substrate-binding protein